MIGKMEKLRKEEIKELYRKITPFISRRLWYLNKVDKWTLHEIYEQCGLSPNRISEIIHYKNYKKDVLNQPNFLLLVGGGNVDMKELMSKDHLTPGEKNWMLVHTVCVNQEFKGLAYTLINKHHVDPTDILKKKLEELEK